MFIKRDRGEREGEGGEKKGEIREEKEESLTYYKKKFLLIKRKKGIKRRKNIKGKEEGKGNKLVYFDLYITCLER